MAYRIAVDRDLCQGHGVCESEAPEVFEVGKDRKVHVLADSPTEPQIAGVKAAVKYCPTHALTLITDEPDTENP